MQLSPYFKLNPPLTSQPAHARLLWEALPDPPLRLHRPGLSPSCEPSLPATLGPWLRLRPLPAPPHVPCGSANRLTRTRQDSQALRPLTCG